MITMWQMNWLLYHFLLDTIAEKEAPAKDNKDFLNAKDKWVKEFSGKTNIEAALNHLIWPI